MNYFNKKIDQLSKLLDKNIQICNVLKTLSLQGGGDKIECSDELNKIYDNILLTKKTSILTLPLLQEFYSNNLSEFNFLNLDYQTIISLFQEIVDSNGIIQKSAFLNLCNKQQPDMNEIAFKIVRDGDYTYTSPEQLDEIKKYLEKSKSIIKMINERIKNGEVFINPKCETTAGKECLEEIEKSLKGIDLNLNFKYELN